MWTPLLTWIPLAPLTLLAPRQEPGLEPGQLAPDLGCRSWMEASVPLDGRDLPGERARQTPAGERSLVRSYHGVPLVVHVFDAGRVSPDELQLLGDLARANVDRGIGVVGVVRGSLDDPLRDGLVYPVASVDAASAECPYATSGARTFVIGPNGALLWQGDPTGDERELLAALQEAYARVVVAPLTGPLHAKLEAAIARYLAADLKGALSRLKKHLRAKEDELAADAVALAELVQQTQDAWLQEARAHGRERPDLRYFEVVRDLRASLPRTDASKELDALEKEVKKLKYWRLRVQDMNNWLELCRERPALFPARVTRACDNFEKDLVQFRRSTTNTNEATKAADALLKRYAQVRESGD